MMNDEQFEKLLGKIDILTKLTAINIVRGKTKTEAVGILTEAGLTQGEIASLLATTTESVKSMRKSLRKRKKTGKAQQQKPTSKTVGVKQEESSQ